MRNKVSAALLLAAALLGCARASAQAVDPAVLPQAACLSGGGPSRDLVARTNGGPLRTAECLIYPYGAGQPRLVCAMNRSCHIILQDGETLRDKSLPDPRWSVASMRGPRNMSAVVVKPRFCDVTTNLLFSTDRRFYSILLDSPPCGGADMDTTRFNPRLPYTDVLVFYYPDEAGVSSFAGDSAAPGAAARPPRPGSEAAPSGRPANGSGAERGNTAATGGPAAGPLHLAYSVRFDRGFPWTPEQVYDNGEATYIYYPENARRYPFPIVYEVASNGSLLAVPFTNAPEHGYIRVDRVVRRLALVVGQPGSPVARLVVERKDGAR
ncbi:MAG TPA: TrbG/VirB9 family P-type conjugative transfer protein [Streptomyces sp.]|nr:TrbG/VirB9 family P-type conjugative transfer protein [Streptomyces sp.]